MRIWPSAKTASKVPGDKRQWQSIDARLRDQGSSIPNRVAVLRGYPNVEFTRANLIAGNKAVVAETGQRATRDTPDGLGLPPGKTWIGAFQWMRANGIDHNKLFGCRHLPWSKKLILRLIGVYRKRHDRWPTTAERARIEGDGRTWSAADYWLGRNEDSSLSTLAYELDGRVRGNDVTREDVRKTVADSLAGGVRPNTRTPGNCNLNIPWETLGTICTRKLACTLRAVVDEVDPLPAMTRKEFDLVVRSLRVKLGRDPTFKNDWLPAWKDETLPPGAPNDPRRHFGVKNWGALLGHPSRPSLTEIRRFCKNHSITTWKAYKAAYAANKLPYGFYSATILWNKDHGFFVEREDRSGANSPHATDPTTIKQIHTALARGEGTQVIANKTGVSRTLVTEIRMGRHYSCRKRPS